MLLWNCTFFMPVTLTFILSCKDSTWKCQRKIKGEISYVSLHRMSVHKQFWSVLGSRVWRECKQQLSTLKYLLGLAKAHCEYNVLWTLHKGSERNVNIKKKKIGSLLHKNLILRQGAITHDKYTHVSLNPQSIVGPSIFLLSFFIVSRFLVEFLRNVELFTFSS